MENFLLTVSSDNSNLCKCIEGYAANSQGKCEKCQVPFCEFCENSDEVKCSQCQEGFDLSDDLTECSCPVGTGISSDNICKPCQVDQCSICPNSFEKLCIQC